MLSAPAICRLGSDAHNNPEQRRNESVQAGWSACRQQVILLIIQLQQPGLPIRPIASSNQAGALSWLSKMLKNRLVATHLPQVWVAQQRALGRSNVLLDVPAWQQGRWQGKGCWGDGVQAGRQAGRQAEYAALLAAIGSCGWLQKAWGFAHPISPSARHEFPQASSQVPLQAHLLGGMWSPMTLPRRVPQWWQPSLRVNGWLGKVCSGSRLGSVSGGEHAVGNIMPPASQPTSQPVGWMREVPQLNSTPSQCHLRK